MGTFAKTQIEEKKKKTKNRLPICVNDLNQNSQTLNLRENIELNLCQNSTLM